MTRFLRCDSKLTNHEMFRESAKCWRWVEVWKNMQTRWLTKLKLPPKVPWDRQQSTGSPRMWIVGSVVADRNLFLWTWMWLSSRFQSWNDNKLVKLLRDLLFTLRLTHHWNSPHISRKQTQSYRWSSYMSVNICRRRRIQTNFRSDQSQYW